MAETTHGAATRPSGLHFPRWHGVMPSILLLRREGSRDEDAGDLVERERWISDRQRPSPSTCLGRSLINLGSPLTLLGTLGYSYSGRRGSVHRHVHPGEHGSKRLLVSNADYDCTDEIQTFPLAANTDPQAR